MVRLSVNLNKVALLRNARAGAVPSVRRCAEACLDAGAHGITVHPRPDGRHTRPGDVHELAALLRERPGVELNVEGNPFPEFLALVHAARPDQCTLVPDAPSALTSDHGWDVAAHGDRLRPIIADLRARGIRVSLFVDADAAQVEAAAQVGADRVELFTGPYAHAHGTAKAPEVFASYARAAERAVALGVGVNAGHDLDLENLGAVRTLPGLREVSIGHALVADALHLGLHAAVTAYLRALRGDVDSVADAPVLVAADGGRGG